MPSDENDWLFDFVLQFLESELFDSAVMDFVDEKCEIFDNEEENKFAYTDIHREFKEHVDALLSSNLGELGVTPELFYEACAKGRNSRDINRTVYDRMIAMDDFQTFKKIMVKRNMELQMEAIQSMKEQNEKESADLKQQEEEEDKRALQQSLLDMELIHKQEELEQLELEQALSISLAIEEERLRLLELEAEQEEQNYGNISDDKSSAKSTSTDIKSLHEGISQSFRLDSGQAETKSSSSNGGGSGAKGGGSTVNNYGDDDNNVDIMDAKRAADAWEAKRTANSSGRKKSPAKDQANSASTPAESKLSSLPPLKPMGFGNLTALPPIRSDGTGDAVTKIEILEEQAEFLHTKQKEVNAAVRRNQEDRHEQRKAEQSIRDQIDTDPDSAEIRAQQMRAQRDRLIAAKKAQREAKVAEEAVKNGGNIIDEETANKIKDYTTHMEMQSAMPVSPENCKESEEAERKRANMRVALARRMKLDLLGEDDANKARQKQYSELDKKLKEVETLRIENHRREQSMKQDMKRQQANFARNMEFSAALIPDHES